mmetsp:Transcript_141784/g.395319  ORF Transcript_141784/g.395319 Transcript_141784/m.395319 type:complete len:341 (+) Transcript_141784:382-1404(+)
MLGEDGLHLHRGEPAAPDEFHHRAQALAVHRLAPRGEGPEEVAQGVGSGTTAHRSLQCVGSGGGHVLPEVRRAARLLLQVALHRRADGARLQQEGVVPVDGVELVVHHAFVARSAQAVRHLLLLPDGEEHVVLHADDERGHHRVSEACQQAGLAVLAWLLHAEAVHGLGDPDHGVGVVVVHPLLALVHEVTLDHELNLKALRSGALVAPLAKPLLPLLARAVGDRPQLPCQLQAGSGQLPLVVIAAVEVRVGHDRLTLCVPEGHAARKALRASGNAHELANALREAARGAEALHATQRSAHAGMHLLDAQVVQQCELCGHLVKDIEPRETAPIPLPVWVE